MWKNGHWRKHGKSADTGRKEWPWYIGNSGWFVDCNTMYMAEDGGSQARGLDCGQIMKGFKCFQVGTLEVISDWEPEWVKILSTAKKRNTTKNYPVQ